MAGIKEKISATMDKLTHKSHTDPNTTGTHGHTTGTGSGLGTSSATGTGAGYDNVSGTTGTGTGYDNVSGTTGTGTGYDNVSGTSAGGLGQTTTTSGAGQYGTTGTTGTTGATTGRGEIIDSETFTKTEDHEVLIEKKRYELEHRPVQKQYVVETKFVGEQQVPGGPTEVVGNEAREVDERIKQAPAGDRTVVVENVDVPAGQLRSSNTTGTTGTGVTGTGATGTGSTY